MNYLNALNISGSGMTAQKLRMDIMAQNIANSDVTRTQAGGPYRRRLVVLQSIDEGGFKTELMKQASLSNPVKYKAPRSILSDVGDANSGGVKVARIFEDQSELVPVYDPTHPDADEDGYVYMPNVNRTEELINMMAATRAYSANITMFNATKSMISSALSIGR
ncbi:MAG: flagellar basal body rod protein FlgC [Clostridiales Family XIII bacterium]|jgi:flagellar basal-body rod protein FlgC|nr:flagellar basal body rod protein FlgC [Clostridiales Family XIII bacterium]